MTDPFSLAAEAAQQLANLTKKPHHDVYVALGSGWAAAADLLPRGHDIAMDSLTGFAAPTATAARTATVMLSTWSISE